MSTAKDSTVVSTSKVAPPSSLSIGESSRRPPHKRASHQPHLGSQPQPYHTLLQPQSGSAETSYVIIGSPRSLAAHGCRSDAFRPDVNAERQFPAILVSQPRIPPLKRSSDGNRSMLLLCMNRPPPAILFSCSVHSFSASSLLFLIS